MLPGVKWDLVCAWAYSGMILHVTRRLVERFCMCPGVNSGAVAQLSRTWALTLRSLPQWARERAAAPRGKEEDSARGQRWPDAETGQAQRNQTGEIRLRCVPVLKVSLVIRACSFATCDLWYWKKPNCFARDSLFTFRIEKNDMQRIFNYFL